MRAYMYARKHSHMSRSPLTLPTKMHISDYLKKEYDKAHTQNFGPSQDVSGGSLRLRLGNELLFTLKASECSEQEERHNVQWARKCPPAAQYCPRATTVAQTQACAIANSDSDLCDCSLRLRLRPV